MTVRSAEAVAIHIAITAKLQSNAAAEAVEEDFAVLLEAYLQSIAFEETLVRYNRVSDIFMGTDGVQDFTELTLNGSASGVELTDEQVPTLGEVSITWI